MHMVSLTDTHMDTQARLLEGWVLASAPLMQQLEEGLGLGLAGCLPGVEGAQFVRRRPVTLLLLLVFTVAGAEAAVCTIIIRIRSHIPVMLEGTILPHIRWSWMMIEMSCSAREPLWNGWNMGRYIREDNFEL